MVRLGLVSLALIALSGCVVYDPGPPVAAAPPPPPPPYYYAPPAYYYAPPAYYAAPSVGIGVGFGDHYRHW
jgi:hypothetical protein